MDSGPLLIQGLWSRRGHVAVITHVKDPLSVGVALMIQTCAHQPPLCQPDKSKRIMV